MKIFTIFFLALFLIELKSQTCFGIRSGIFLAKHDYGTMNDEKSGEITAIDVSVLMKLPLIKKLYFQPELTFIQKGGNKNFLIDNLKIKTNQIEIASLLKYQVKVQKIFVFCNAGLFMGRVLSVTTKGNPFNYLKEDNLYDYGFIYGSGIGIQLKNSSIIIEGRVRRSQNDVSS